ncbi:hypothetical protein A2U01_0076892 [Trifolium medium]|uniref:Uncharacterized protein n=1 Tax=Trifolium medium TaxID=97028 RepID=A0A392T3E5_9FABA|nr:hypothetical protein [Trifolium medium]
MYPSPTLKVTMVKMAAEKGFPAEREMPVSDVVERGRPLARE